MDAIDAAILDALTANARESFRDLGERVGLSANAAAARVRRLEDAGVIDGYTVIRGDAAGEPRGLEVYIDVRLEPTTDYLTFMACIKPMPQIVDAAHLTGPTDVLVRAFVPDTSVLDGLLRRLKVECGVAQTQTRIVLRRLQPEGPRRPSA